MSWIPAAIAGASSLIGGIMGNKASAKAADKAALAEYGYTKSLMSEAHQIEVADLRAAGLNPILSGTGGGGASGSVSVSPASPRDVVSPAVASALAARRNEADVELLEETAAAKAQEVKANLPHFQVENMKSQFERAASETFLNNQLSRNKQLEEKLTTQQILTEQERTKSQAADAVRLMHEAEISRSSAVMANRDAEIAGTKAGEVMRWLEMLRNATGFSARGSSRR